MEPGIIGLADMREEREEEKEGGGRGDFAPTSKQT